MRRIRRFEVIAPGFRGELEDLKSSHLDLKEKSTGIR
jgi:hypothetical protein